MVKEIHLCLKTEIMETNTIVIKIHLIFKFGEGIYAYRISHIDLSILLTLPVKRCRKIEHMNIEGKKTSVTYSQWQD